MASPYLMLFGMFSSGILLCYCEKEMVAHITDGETTAIAISKLYGGVILINCVGSFFLLFYLGLLVSQARTKYRAKAEKAGDDRADDRFSYPKLYAEGFSEEAKHFNCVQRAHQHAIETHASFVVLSVIGGWGHPLLVSLSGLLWIFARLDWAWGYSTGEPAARYGGKMGFHIWSSLLLIVAAAVSTGVQLLMA